MLIIMSGEFYEDKCTKPDTRDREDGQERPGEHEVIISIAGGNEIVSSITTHSAEKLNLREGAKVYAIMKASEVMVGID